MDIILGSNRRRTRGFKMDFRNEQNLNHQSSVENGEIKPKDVSQFLKDYFKNPPYKYYIAFYNTFPGAKNAEFEMLKRFYNICRKLDIGFLVISNDNIIHNTDLKGVNINEIDETYILCCISLHFLSPKTSKHYTLLALWNPIRFHSKVELAEIMNVDGFLSAHSNYVDDAIKSESDKPFLGYLNTSTDGPIYPFTFGEYTCFYAGMNWKISEDDIRNKIYQLIKLLDPTNIVATYGLKPNWKGYRSYRGEIPFDGVSMIKEIHKCGICLVLSSEHHITESICSCRVFEGLAAGVPIIADKNPFFQEWFGDNLFYIDTEDAMVAARQIVKYISYFKSNPEETMAKMENCRKVFLENFLLDKQLLEVIENVKKIRA